MRQRCNDRTFHVRLEQFCARLRSDGIRYTVACDGEHMIKASNDVPFEQINNTHGMEARRGDWLTASIATVVRPRWSDQELAGTMMMMAMWLRCHEVQERTFLDAGLAFDPHEFGNLFTGLLHGVSGALGQWNTTADLGSTTRKFFLLLDDEREAARAAAQ